ncbi:sugar ABC transporter ATP-binding protein [Peribacillus frigoritolerans]|uniref:sugar ABC transporter ATP-binding protein n=1 Tax=Peribacillus frigoritolerans TaxID=450367 RepID=UPI003D2C896E
MDQTYRIEMNNIKKSFGKVNVLKNVSLKVKPGEIHAFLGENGAGKSTLMKVLSGIHKKDDGEIKIDGNLVDIKNPNIAKELGIGIIYQELALAPDLTVAENIFLGSFQNKKGIVKWNEMNSKASELIKSIGFQVNPKTITGYLSVAHQQVVEICKALSQNVKVLILDEPTAVLAPQDVEKLFDILKTLKSQGVSIIYISHRLEEIFEIADAITVLKDGEVTGSVLPKEVSKDQLISMMIGRNLEALFPERNAQIGKEILKIVNLSTKEKLKNVSLTVHAGEVVGLAGLVGSGRTEIARALFGVDKLESGEFILDGKSIQTKSPSDAVAKGIGLVPESRKEDGLVLPMSIRKNITMTQTKSITKFVNVIQSKKEKGIANDLIQKLRIKTNSCETPVENLSGGNQQKVVLAKWFHTNTKVLILDEPTRGVDVGAKVEIYQLINELAEKGLGIIVISSELLEVIGLCDRIYVMDDGRIKGSLTKEDSITEAKIMSLAVGGS